MRHRALPSKPGRFPWWVNVIVLAGVLLLLAGAIIGKLQPKLLLSSNQPVTAATKVYADYLFSRNLVLAVSLVALLAFGRRRLLASLMTLIVGIQLVDAAVDIFSGRGMLIPILIVYAVVYFLCAWWLFGAPPWSGTAWREESNAWQ